MALNIGLFGKKKKKESAKMSFGTYIHSLQSSVFARRKKEGKKDVAEAGRWFIVCLFIKA